MSESSEARNVLPPEPEAPLDSDCCGSGCVPCIFDVHADNLVKWRRQCQQATIDTVDLTAKRSPLSRVRYVPLRLTDVAPNTRDINVYTFQAVETPESEVKIHAAKTQESAVKIQAVEMQESAVKINADKTTESEVIIHAALGIGLGQHLIMRGVTNAGTYLSRAYTPLSDSHGSFRILVKLYPDGAMSRYFSSLSVGDLSHFRGPYGDFSYRPNTHKRTLLLCAGTGLAPLYRIATSVVDNETDETVVRLLYSVRSLRDVALREELHAMRQYWNFTARFHVTGCRDDSRPRYGEDVVYGRINEDTIRDELKGGQADTLVLICGTESFNDDMRLYVKEHGVRNVHVF